MLTPPRTVVRREGGLYALERALQRRGFALVAGADEAGRGACAGPLVAAAAVLPEGKRGEIDGLADSKLLTPAARERVYAEVVARGAGLRRGGHPAGRGRRARPARVQPRRRCAGRWPRWPPRPDYVLTDGFPVRRAGRAGPRGVEGRPGRGLRGGGQRAGQGHPGPDHGRAATSGYPEYGFAEHKGYCTAEHSAALTEHGPCAEHRFSYVNVAAVRRATSPRPDAASTRAADARRALRVPSAWRRASSLGRRRRWGKMRPWRARQR